MRILYDARKITPNLMTGLGNVSKGLLSSLLKYKDLEVIAFTRKGVKHLPELSKINQKLTICETSDDSDYFGIKRVWFEQLRLPALIDQYRPEILHLTIGTSVPRFLDKDKYRLKIILTIHDLIPLTEYNDLMSFFDRQIYKNLLSYSFKKADMIVAISKFTAGDIQKYFPGITNPRVIHNGIQPVKTDDKLNKKWPGLKAKLKISQNFIFYLGGFAPKKNLQNLIKAYNLLRKNKKIDYQLVLGGKLPTKEKAQVNYKQILALISECRLENDVRIINYISEEEKAILFTKSAFIVYPSLYEGFGLPVLEALSIGKPVVTTQNSPMEEIARSNALYFDPKNVVDIAEKIQEMINNHQSYQRKLESLKEKFISEYSWDNIARKYYDLYRELTRV